MYGYVVIPVCVLFFDSHYFSMYWYHIVCLEGEN